MLTAVDIMTDDVIGICDSATVAQAIALMQHHKVRSLIVEHPQDSDAYGIVTERDIVYKVTATGTDPAAIGVASIMREPCIAVEPSFSLTELAQVFADTGIQRAPVIQNGALAGDCLHHGYSDENRCGGAATGHYSVATHSSRTPACPHHLRGYPKSNFPRM